MVYQTIKDKLNQAFEPAHLEVINESYMHNVPEDAETHFKVVVVSKRFEGKRLLSRHREINGVLASELAGPVHALAIHTYTEGEWRELSAGAPQSPNCRGGFGL